MAEYTNSAGVPSLNAALMHTLQRHRDILQVTKGPPACLSVLSLAKIIIIIYAGITACWSVSPGGENATDFHLAFLLSRHLLNSELKKIVLFMSYW